VIETIMQYDGVIPDEICDNVIKRYEEIEDSFIFKAKVHRGESFDTRNNDILYLVDNEELKKEDPELVNLTVNYILNTVYDKVILKYNASMDNAFDGLPFWTIDELDLLKYHKGQGFYTEHIDSDGVNANRYFSIIIYLNDVEEGGGTNFPLHDKTVQPKKGSVVIFPSYWTHPHKAITPVSNDKYVLVCWAVPDLGKIKI